MTVLLAALAFQRAGLIELPSKQDRVSIQAVAPLGRLTATEKGMMQVLVRAMSRATQEFSRRDMLMTTSGEPVRCDFMPDHVRVGITVPPTNLHAGLSLLDNLLHRATLSDDDLVRSSKGPAEASRWMAPLWPQLFPTDPLKPALVRALYARVFRPESVVVAVSGRFTPADPTAFWNSKLAQWQLPRAQAFRDDYSAAKERPAPAGPKVFALQTPAKPEPATLLALFALGSGKGAAMYRVLREKLGLSYRQEAVLWPTETGFNAALIFASTQQIELARVRQALVEDVDRWSEADRNRALGIANAVLVRGLDFSPLYFTPAGPVTDSQDDQTFLAAYWRMKTGESWSPQAILDAMSAIPLPQLRAAAKSLVTP